LPGCYAAPGTQLNRRSGTFLPMPVVARFNRTPVKGMALEQPEDVRLTPQGIPGDRLFYLVEASGANFSGSDFGPLVRIRPVYESETERLTMTFPDGTVAEGDAADLGAPFTTNFYGRAVNARAVEGPWSEAVSLYVGEPVRLLRCDRQGEGVDVHSLTLVSDGSVRDLAVKGGYEGVLDPRRFRINLEIEGCAPYEEDTWEGQKLHFGGSVVRVLGQIPRCLVTTQDPETGLKDWDTLKHIARSRPRIAGSGGLPLGMYAEVEIEGAVSTGDQVLPFSDF
jgi:uncharacterized protein YcbX